MFTGLFAGIMWSLETVVIGIAFAMTPFVSGAEAALLAPFAGTFLHDAFSAVFMLVYNAVRGNLKKFSQIFKSPGFGWLVLSSAIGGPVGMTGYVLAVRCMGASIGAVASAVYPAIGTALAYFFLKEKVRWYQWIFLITALLGVYGLSYSPGIEISNFWIGLLGTFMCAFGWGVEAVILAKCFKNPDITNECALGIRQAVSALLYAVVIIPVMGGWDFTLNVLNPENIVASAILAGASLCATVSYLFYYRAIDSLGASKAMALNITYTAWAIVFTAVLCRDFSVLNPVTVGCAAIVVVCGIFAATDFKSLFTRKKD